METSDPDSLSGDLSKLSTAEIARRTDVAAAKVLRCSPDEVHARAAAVRANLAAERTTDLSTSHDTANGLLAIATALGRLAAAQERIAAAQEQQAHYTQALTASVDAAAKRVG